MSARIHLILAVVVLVAGMSLPVGAEEKPRAQGKAGPEQQAEGPKEPSKDTICESVHTVQIGGKAIEYIARAGLMSLKEDKEDPKAQIFFISYTRKDTQDPAKRPITFSFNGGPGSSSVWLHLGLLGPRRVSLDSNGFSEGPPYRLVDNEYSLLDQTDLVFIDPVSTGFSRTLGEEDPKQFHGLEEDVRSVGEFIRLYITRYERWGSPKFLIGESYGTTRAAGLAGYLQDDRGIYLNGIMLVSSILNFETTDFAEGNDLPFVLFLPTYTATAWYHKRLPADLQSDLQAALRESEAFAQGDYARALLAGDRLSAADSALVIAKLARLTGLSEEYIRLTNLRVWIWRFCKELLRDERTTVGRLDSRFVGVGSDAAGEGPEYDPSASNNMGPFSAAMNDYLRRELKFATDLPYEILTGKVWPWSYRNYENSFVNVATTLRDAINQNPQLKVWVAAGYYDLATPYFAAEYTLSHLGLEPALRGNVSIHHYEAGHMMYIHLPSLVKMKADLTAFIDSAVPDR
jgi:carboxypeptidase C (cathepsin A)